ncbi:GH25 family lysozyme [Streptobacillus felis]|uniref:Glycoside hydrolase n=1 Tax=Streptobacillus felis TaxID=1384509 RepID=A0A7Z0TBL5_9FUSO|nr:GH25 family lysozyme [Streptobacillus felis]NYV27503.1 glycoside hydrolase [Streptobacillus felis]
MKKIIMGLILLTFLGGLAWYLELSGHLYHNHILSQKYDIHGIDISHHQVRLNWSQIDKRYKFVFMKATEGKDHLDRDFFYNWNRAQLTGFRVGAYHFFSMLSTGEEQAKFYISKVPIVDSAFPPIVDLEIPTKYPKEVVNKELKDLIDILEMHYKKRVIIYVTRHTYGAYIENEFLNNPIWIRNIKWYPSQERWDFWQYSNRGRVKGISGFTDRNAFRGEDIDNFINNNRIK